jgi:hypothetical protein
MRRLEETSVLGWRRVAAVALVVGGLAALPACGRDDVERGADRVEREGKEVGGRATDAAEEAGGEAEDAARDARGKAEDGAREAETAAGDATGGK